MEVSLNTRYSVHSIHIHLHYSFTFNKNNNNYIYYTLYEAQVYISAVAVIVPSFKIIKR